MSGVVNHGVARLGGAALRDEKQPASHGVLAADLPLLTAALVAVPTVAMASALRSGAESGLTLGIVLVPAVTAVVFFLWGLWRVREHRRCLRVRLRDREWVSAQPAPGQELFVRAMASAGLRFPRDREDFVLLRNAAAVSGGHDPFTAGVLVWAIAVNGRLSGTLSECLREMTIPKDAVIGGD